MGKENMIGYDFLKEFCITVLDNPYIYNGLVIGHPMSLTDLYNNEGIKRLVPKKKGIYHLFNSKGDIVYIGISNNMQKRLYEHAITINKKNLFVLYFITNELSMKEIHEYEIVMIHKLNPILNIKKYKNNSQLIQLRAQKHTGKKINEII